MEIVKNKQRYFLAVLLLLCSALNINAEVLTGSCGDNVTYTLNTESGLLEIKGTGPMADYSYSSPSPWDSKSSSINECIISEGVTTVGDRALYFCSNLTSVTIPNSVTSIGDVAFYDCNLTSIAIPNSVTTIGDFAFSYCSNLTSITIPNSVSNIGSYAFNGCSKLPVENNIRYADTYLVGVVNKECTSITIKEGTRYILDYAFQNCSALTSVTIPSSVTTIGSYAFMNCSGLTSVTIPSSVTTIGDAAFRNCSGLTTVTIGSGVTSIEYSSFEGCTSLTDVTCRRKTPPSIYSSSFSNYGTLHILPGSKSDYEKDSWGNYWKYFTIVEDAEVLPLCAAPTIEYSNGKIACKSETVGATCYISYTIKSVSKGTGNVAVEIPQIEISAYAIAEGYDASDTVTKTFDYVSAGNGGSGDVNGDGKVTMADANAIVNMVLGK